MRTTLLSILLVLVPATGLCQDEFKTAKIAHVYGVIDDESAVHFLDEIAATVGIPGDRVILIDSPGGSVSSGNAMIEALENEKATGVHVTCIVTHIAESMAFNLLTHCDTRIADIGALLLFHKIEIGGRIPGVRMTARNLRKIAEELDQIDDMFRIPNAKALGMSLEDYDFYADHETVWNASLLLRIGYLNAVGHYSQASPAQ